ncbi:unnamed protein product [Darwinula stevensoni]|uniref:Uncharacterized protein n=1 Tax=Darwinula stevensoni TaxID=69355 RepID=A0A7R9FSD6_9CRUS|nr:unnamed protein product [Darwinula stevensoni]CAG0902431.1 unnamed protein product [Darwinula stevensoni]
MEDELCQHSQHHLWFLQSRVTVIRGTKMIEPYPTQKGGFMNRKKGWK